MAAQRVIVVGGSDGGVMAALWAKITNPEVSVEMIVRDAFVNYSVCGAPFYLGGEVREFSSLAHRSLDDIAQAGIQVHLNAYAEDIDAHAAVLSVRTGGTLQKMAYDELIVATGAQANRPNLPGIGLPGVFTLHDMVDTQEIERYIAQHSPRCACVIGAGYIGLEMVEALSRRGMRVTLIEKITQILPTVDETLARRLTQRLDSAGIIVRVGTGVSAVQAQGDALTVECDRGASVMADLVIVAVGVHPSSRLAETASAKLDRRGAVVVNRRMESSVPHVYAAGDGVSTWHRMLGSSYLPLGTTAHKQGRVAGINAAGGDAIFEGVVGTQVVKVFDHVVARTGLKDAEAVAAGFVPLTVESEVPDHKAYYPSAHPLWIRITADRNTTRLLGAQILGTFGTEVSKRIDLLALGLWQEVRVADILSWDLSYTPPLSSPYDPVQMAAAHWLERRAALSRS